MNELFVADTSAEIEHGVAGHRDPAVLGNYNQCIGAGRMWASTPSQTAFNV